MSKKVIMGVPPRCGKTAILEAFENMRHPKCQHCGAKLNKYWYYTEYSQIQYCKKCGKLNEKKR